ncbi:hypothetical protein Ahy_B03g068202 isoform F [Arachis hypogaea]|uniref:Uncharacterized protein n=1 Tax=Arachis hypogaea TaxID=3818 RepID=A0A445A8Y0_ARAHY|nr:hypothetical protein Ahy_B03g068202 isoform F [Arachis hypogaea]
MIHLTVSESVNPSRREP